MGRAHVASLILEQTMNNTPKPFSPLWEKDPWNLPTAAPRLRVAHLGHSVSAEAAEIGAQLAPGDDQAHRLMIADGERPDGALADPGLFVAIGERDLAAAADGVAHGKAPAKRGPVWQARARAKR